MTIRDFERRLQECNPKLHIKTYGAGKAGIHLGTRYLCRIEPWDIEPYNRYRVEIGQADHAMSDFNPKGTYKYNLLLGRGRAETARLLYAKGVITFADISKLSK